MDAERGVRSVEATRTADGEGKEAELRHKADDVDADFAKLAAKASGVAYLGTFGREYLWSSSMCSFALYSSSSGVQKWKPVGRIGSSSSGCSWSGSSWSAGLGRQRPHCVLGCVKHSPSVQNIRPSCSPSLTHQHDGGSQHLWLHSISSQYSPSGQAYSELSFDARPRSRSLHRR